MAVVRELEGKKIEILKNGRYREVEDLANVIKEVASVCSEVTVEMDGNGKIKKIIGSKCFGAREARYKDFDGFQELQ